MTKKYKMTYIHDKVEDKFVGLNDKECIGVKNTWTFIIGGCPTNEISDDEDKDIRKILANEVLAVLDNTDSDDRIMSFLKNTSPEDGIEIHKITCGSTWYIAQLVDLNMFNICKPIKEIHELKTVAREI